MTLNNEYLLDRTVYGTASGNYDGSSQLFYGDPVRAANYYGGQGSIQTATIRVTGFVGIITLQATLNDQPSIEAAWFDLETYGDGSTADTDTRPFTITGNFTFMRVRVDGFDAGTIDNIILTY
jgi:hypothetical protein